jgi:hypothetical protein
LEVAKKDEGFVSNIKPTLLNIRRGRTLFKVIDRKLVVLALLRVFLYNNNLSLHFRNSVAAITCSLSLVIILIVRA